MLDIDVFVCSLKVKYASSFSFVKLKIFKKVQVFKHLHNSKNTLDD